MLYTSIDDFFEKASSCRKLPREEEIYLAEAMYNGDASAREQLIRSYIPMVAGHIKRCSPHMQTLRLVYTCLRSLEKAVDSFNFLQTSETFTHRLSWWLRQAVTEYIAGQSEGI